MVGDVLRDARQRRVPRRPDSRSAARAEPPARATSAPSTGTSRPASSALATSSKWSSRRLRARRRLEVDLLAQDRGVQLLELRARVDAELRRRARAAPRWKASSASACRPARYSASISCPRSRSRSGCSATSVSSSPTSSGVRPASRSASSRSSSAASRSSSSRRDLAPANVSKANSASGGPRQSASASRQLCARCSAGPPSPRRRRPLERDRRRAGPDRREAGSRAASSRAPSVPERLPQLRDEVLERGRRRPRRLLAPERVDRADRSRPTRPASSRSSASKARCFGPPSSTRDASARTSSGPSSRNSSRKVTVPLWTSAVMHRLYRRIAPPSVRCQRGKQGPLASRWGAVTGRFGPRSTVAAWLPTPTFQFAAHGAASSARPCRSSSSSPPSRSQHPRRLRSAER